MARDSKKTLIRQDVQMWRGLAVLAVMLSHFGGVLVGGFLGVDIFFAISGFVITLSFFGILRDSKSWKSTLFEFWRRRFWRLVPALVTVIAVTTLAAFFLLTPRAFGDQVEMALWSTFFAGNVGVELVTRADYFDQGAKENWLLHLWSLGVEEQFYLLFPLLFLFLVSLRLGNSRRKILTIGFFVVTVISLTIASINDFATEANLPERIREFLTGSSVLGYYSPVTRAWQFGVGILAALAVYWRDIRPRAGLSIIGIATLVLAFLFFPPSDTLPGPQTTVPMLAIVVLLIWRLPDRISAHLALRPLRWLGDRSYSAYLWHWPLWTVLLLFFSPSPALVVLAIVLTVTLAQLTYRYVEQPFISHQSHSAVSKTPQAGSRFPVLFIAIGLSFTVSFGPAVLALHHGFERGGLIASRAETPKIDPLENCVITSCAGGELDILLVGDSHAGALFTALESELSSVSRNVNAAITNGCLHLPSRIIVSTSAACAKESEEIRTLIANGRPNTVVLYGYTAGRFTETNSGLSQAISLRYTGSEETILADQGPEAYEAALTETARFISSLGSDVVIVRSTPDFPTGPHEIFRNGQTASQFLTLFAGFKDRQFGHAVSRDELLERHGQFAEIESLVAEQQPRVQLVDSWSEICSPTICAQTDEAGNLLFADTDHLSAFGARLLATRVTASIQRTG